jgi:hypothetical protein
LQQKAPPVSLAIHGVGPDPNALMIDLRVALVAYRSVNLLRPIHALPFGAS